MLTTILGSILAFVLKALSVTYSILAFMIPFMLKISFGLFIFTTDLALILFALFALTIFLAPTEMLSMIRRDTSDYHPIACLLVPFVFLPELLKGFMRNRIGDVIYLTVATVKGLGDLVIGTGKWFAHKTKLDLLFPTKAEEKV